MSSVDNRIVELEVNNRNFEKGIQEAIKALNSLTEALQLKDAGKGLDSIETKANKFNLGGMSQSVQHVADAFSAMGVVGFTVLQRLTNAAIDAGKTIVSAVINPLIEGGKRRALNIEQAKFQIEGLGYAWEDVAEDINYGVKDTAYGLDSAAKAASQLLASNVAVGDSMKQALRGISGVAAMTNSEYDDIARVFTTVAGNGRLMGDQLLQLSTRGLNVAATLGKALGKSEQEIRDMVSKGQIDFATFAAAMDDAFGTHAKEANKTFEGALSNIKAALSRIGADFATPSYESLRKVMVSMIPVIDGIHKALGPLVQDYEKSIDELAEFAIKLNEAFDITAVEQFVNKLHILFEGVKSVVVSLYEYLDAFAKNVGSAFSSVFPGISEEAVKKLSDGLVEFSKNLEMSDKTASKIRTSFRGIFTIISNVGKALVNVAKPFINNIKVLGAGVASFAGSVGTVLDGVGKLLNSVSSMNGTSIEIYRTFNGLFSIFKIFGAGLEALGNLIVLVFSGINNGSKSAERLYDVLVGLTGAGVSVGMFIDQLIDKFQSLYIIEQVASIIQGAFSVIFDLAEIIGKTVTIAAESFVEAIGSIPDMSSGTLKFLTRMVYGLDEVLKQISQLDGASEKLKNTFDGLFSIFRLAGAILSAVGSAFAAIFETVAGSLNIASDVSGVLSATSDVGLKFSAIVDVLVEKIGNFSTKLNDSIRNGEGFKTFVGSVVDLFHRFTSQISEFFEALSGGENVTDGFYKIMVKLGSLIQTAFSAVVGAIQGFIQNLDFSQILAVLNTGLLAGAYKILYDLAVFFKKTEFTSLFEWGKNLDSTLSVIKGSLLSLQRSVQVQNIVAVAVAIGIMAASLKVLSDIDPTRLSTAATAITLLYTALATSITKLPISQFNSASLSMIAISAALLIMSHALDNLAKLDLIGLSQGVIAVGLVLTELSVFLNKTDFSKSIKPSTGLGLILLAEALNVLSSAVEKFGSMNLETLAKGLISVGIALGEFALFANFTSGSKNMVSTGLGMVLLAASLNILADAISAFGSMDIGVLAKGFISMGVGLGIIAGAMNLMPKNMLSSGVGLLFVATALNSLAKALEKMGGMSIEQIAKSIATLAASLGVIAIAMNVMKGTLGGAAALLVVAGALSILAPVLILFGSMSLEQIGTALLMLAGAFAVFGVAAALLTPVAPTLLMVSASVALFGAGCLAAGLGVAAFATGLVALAGALGTSGAAIITTFRSLVELLPFVFEQLGLAILALINVVAENIPALVDMIVVGLQSLLEGIITLTPTVVETVTTLVTSIVTAIVEMAPMLIQAGFDLIIAFLTGIRDNIGEIASLAGEIMVEFINGITEKIPDLVEAGFNMIITFIESLAETIQNEGERLRDAVGELVTTIIEFAIETILGFLGWAGEAGGDLLQAVIDGIASLGGMLLDTVTGIIDDGIQGILGFLGDFLNAGVDLLTNLIDGVISLGGDVLDTLKGIVDDGVQGVLGFVDDFLSAGHDLVWGLIDGIKEIGGQIASTITGFVGDAIEGAKNLLGIASPSKVFKRIGKYTVEGFIIGMEQLGDEVYETSESIGQKAIDGSKAGINKLVSYLDTEMDYNPTIKPVVDMRDVKNGVIGLNQMFTNSEYSKMAGINANNQLVRSVSVSKEEIFDDKQIVAAINSLEEKVAALPDEIQTQVDLYMDSKKVASSMAPAMNKELGKLAKRGGLS